MNAWPTEGSEVPAIVGRWSAARPWRACVWLPQLPPAMNCSRLNKEGDTLSLAVSTALEIYIYIKSGDPRAVDLGGVTKCHRTSKREMTGSDILITL